MLDMYKNILCMGTVFKMKAAIGLVDINAFCWIKSILS